VSTTLSVAYSELTRVLPWSLRALGYAFGTADRGAHLVAVAAAMNPAVLDEVCQAGRRPSHRLRGQRSKGLVALDGAGISLLEMGPAAIDGLAAHAAGSGWAACRIPAATELSLVPATLVGAMEYDLCSIGIVARDDTLDWHLAEPGFRGLLYCGQGRESLLGLLAGNKEVLESIAAAELTSGSVLLMASAGRPELRPSGHAAVKPQEKIAAAHRKGIPVSRQTLDAFYALEMLTWAPTSERSRAQAGFTVAPVAAP
jgi:hypothetical protein